MSKKLIVEIMTFDEAMADILVPHGGWGFENARRACRARQYFEMLNSIRSQNIVSTIAVYDKTVLDPQFDRSWGYLDALAKDAKATLDAIPWQRGGNFGEKP